MLGDAISFPAKSDDWIPTLLIGGLLTAFSVFVVPGFVVQGYSVRVLRRAARGEEEVPSFTDWGELFVDGLKLFVVTVVYLFAVPVPLAVVVVALFSVGPLDGASSTVSGLLGVAILLGVGVLSLAVGYVLPAAYANFALEKRLEAAFDFETILRGALTGDYVVAWLLALVVGFVGGLVASALAIVLVGIPLLFYVQVVTYYLYGRGFAEGLRSKGELV